MNEPYVICPLCGLGFERQDTLCAHACPLGAMCRLIRCPGCEYEFPETPSSVSWLVRLLGRPPAPELPARHLSLLDIEHGERVRVLCLGARSSGRYLPLAAFGLIPGSEIELLQRRPACVVRIDETDLALDPDIAREILVERLDTDTPAGEDPSSHDLPKSVLGNPSATAQMMARTQGQSGLESRELKTWSM